VDVSWQPLDLTRKGPDGKVEIRPVRERLRELFPIPSVNARPLVVWIVGQGGDHIRAHVLRRRDITLALERFRCLRVDTYDLPDGDRKKRLVRGAGFRFYDPAADLVGRPLVGRRAHSAAAFADRQEKAWQRSFTVRLRDYIRPRHAIQDRYDRNRLRQWVIKRGLVPLQWNPSPKRRARYEEDLARLRAEAKEIEKDLAALAATCRPRPEFLSAPPQKTERPRLR